MFLSFFQRISIQQNKSHTHTKKQNPKKQTKNPRQHNSGLLSQTEVKTLKYWNYKNISVMYVGMWSTWTFEKILKATKVWRSYRKGKILELINFSGILQLKWHFLENNLSLSYMTFLHTIPTFLIDPVTKFLKIKSLLTKQMNINYVTK